MEIDGPLSHNRSSNQLATSPHRQDGTPSRNIINR